MSTSTEVNAVLEDWAWIRDNGEPNLELAAKRLGLRSAKALERVLDRALEAGDERGRRRAA